jgi:hypothetical protein
MVKMSYQISSAQSRIAISGRSGRVLVLHGSGSESNREVKEDGETGDLLALSLKQFLSQTMVTSDCEIELELELE